MRTVDLVIHSSRQLVTAASPGSPKRGIAMRDAGVIRGGAIAIDSDSIVAVGDSDSIRREYQASNEVDATGHTVLPGFVDPHTHAVFAGNRLDEFELKLQGADYLEILKAGGGILATTDATRSATREQLVEGARWSLARMMSLGTTTCEIKTGYGLDLPSELKMLEVIADLDERLPLTIVPTFMPAHAVPREFAGRPREYVDLITSEMLPTAARWYASSRFYSEGRPFFVDVYCESGAFSVNDSRRILEAARSLGFPIKAHVDQFNNLGGAGMALGLGATSIDHLDHLTEAELREVSSSQTIAVITPAANLSSGATRFANARALIDSGAAVALTTDFNPGSSPCLSLPLVMAIACRYCRMLPAEALNAVTINAAHAVGMGKALGSLEPGKQADVLIADVDDFRALAFELGGNPIQTVISNGRKILPV